jgi:hypothetical protein
LWPIIFLLPGCLQNPLGGEEGPPGYYSFGGPGNFSVQSISNIKVKISWSSSYSSPVIVERSNFNDSLFSLIHSKDTSNYFYDSNLVDSRQYYYRFRGFTPSDTSSFSYLTIAYDSVSRLIQSVSTNKNSSSITSTDDGTLISVVTPDWGGFDIRRYSDLSLVATRTRGDPIGNIGGETRFGSDANRLLTWWFNYASIITLTPDSSVQISIPDTINFTDMYYIENDTKILALATNNNGAKASRSYVLVYDLQTNSFVQQIDTLQGELDYTTSSISADRSKVMTQSTSGFYVIDISPIIAVRFLSLPVYYPHLCFLKNPDSAVGLAFNSIGYINTRTGATYKSVRSVNTNFLNQASLYADESRILTASYTYAQEAYVYNLGTGNLEQHIDDIGPDIYVEGVFCSKTDQSFIILFSNGVINKYSTVEFDKQWQAVN